MSSIPLVSVLIQNTIPIPPGGAEVEAPLQEGRTGSKDGPLRELLQRAYSSERRSSSPASDGSAVLRTAIMISISSRSKRPSATSSFDDLRILAAPLRTARRTLAPRPQGSGDVAEYGQRLADGIVLRAEEPEGHLARGR